MQTTKKTDPPTQNQRYSEDLEKRQRILQRIAAIIPYTKKYFATPHNSKYINFIKTSPPQNMTGISAGFAYFMSKSSRYSSNSLTSPSQN